MTRRPARTRNRRVVREADRIQTRLLLWGLLGGLVVLVPLLANVWGHAETVRLGYRLEQARAAQVKLLEINRLLRTEHASLRNLSRIEKMATRDLGLRPRRPEDTVVVSVIAPVDEGEPQDGSPRMVARSITPAAHGGSR